MNLILKMLGIDIKNAQDNPGEMVGKLDAKLKSLGMADEQRLKLYRQFDRALQQKIEKLDEANN